MLTYDCISTGYNIGFIEVIKNSLTIFKVQSDGGFRSEFQRDKSQLYKWIVAQNPNKFKQTYLSTSNYVCLKIMFFFVPKRRRGGVKLYQIMCRFLCGHLYFGHWRSPPGQHNDKPRGQGKNFCQ